MFVFFQACLHRQCYSNIFVNIVSAESKSFKIHLQWSFRAVLLGKCILIFESNLKTKDLRHTLKLHVMT